MSTKDEIRFYRPAPYTRDAGAEAKVRRIYHPRRHPSHPLRVLADGGEIVTVRPGETAYWMRLEQQGDVIRGSKDELDAATAAIEKAKADADAAAEKAKRDAEAQAKKAAADAKKAATKEIEG